MPITEDDIQLLESERLTDASNAGGRMTINVVPDNVAGNVFPKISRLDATYGRVNLRKLYLAVRTALADLYSGAHVIVSRLPVDSGKVQPLLFSTGSSFDTRADARNRIESYVVSGPESPYVLYGTQVRGQQQIKVYCRLSAPIPDIGDVLCLSIEAGESAGNTQFVRVVDIESTIGEFTERLSPTSDITFTRRVLTLAISAPLVRDFPGKPVTRLSDHGSDTLVRETIVADAAQYYGTQPLAEAAQAGALAIRVASVYGQLVPSTRRETPVTGGRISDTSWLAPAAAATVTSGFTHNWDTSGYETVTIRIPAGADLSEVLIRRADYWGTAFTLYFVGGVSTNTFPVYSGSSSLQCASASYDRERGIITLSIIAYFAVDVFTTYTPAAIVSNPAHTRDIPVTLATRGLVYSETLLPIPAPGTLVLDYRALGKWYRLRDDGTGKLAGADESVGSGTIDYGTGALAVTLGALPDVGSAVLLAWGSPVHHEIRAGDTAVAGDTLDLTYTLAQRPVVPSTVTISYPVNGTPRDVTDNGAGVLSGNGVTGTIDYATGTVSLRFSQPPDRASLIDNAYTWRDGADLYNPDTTAAVNNGQFTVDGAPFRAAGATLSLQLSGLSGISGNPVVRAYITAGGALRVGARKLTGTTAVGGRYSYAILDQQVGIFDFNTGVGTITSHVAVLANIWTASGIWLVTTYHPSVVSVFDFVIERDTATYDPRAVTGEQVSPSQIGLTFDLTTTVADRIVPGSVMFRASGKTYIDRGTGTLYADVDPLTGSGTVAGSIDYDAGSCVLDDWADNVNAAIAVDACLTQYGDWTANEAHFRTSGSPIRPASLFVQATAIDGTLITGTADINGLISGTWVRGEIQQDMGVVSVEFGQEVNGEWVPTDVMPGTIRYNCVVLADLPLDASILGLDPVRLPSDGRVPIYRPANVLVIHHTAEDALPDPAVAGATYALSRGALDYVEVVDQGGYRVPRDRYAIDLDQGEVTMADPLDLEGFTQPLIVRHRIEDMALAADVQITGEIALGSPLTHDYPAAETLVSSALVAGDLWANVSALFDQATWTGVWQDSRIGSGANAEYDAVGYPIEVRNDGAITERWRVHFTSSTAFSLYGENLGLIATGNTNTDLAPVNAFTGLPYFTLRAGGWGGGWATGNQLRFNTRGANYPIWISRSILAGASRSGDRFDLAIRGDTDDV